MQFPDHPAILCGGHAVPQGGQGPANRAQRRAKRDRLPHLRKQLPRRALLHHNQLVSGGGRTLECLERLHCCGAVWRRCWCWAVVHHFACYSVAQFACYSDSDSHLQPTARSSPCPAVFCLPLPAAWWPRFPTQRCWWRPCPCGTSTAPQTSSESGLGLRASSGPAQRLWHKRMQHALSTALLFLPCIICHSNTCLPPLLRHTLPIPPLPPRSPAWCFALQNVVMRLPWVFAESWVWTLMVSQRWFQAGRQMSQRRCCLFAGAVSHGTH